jgi:large subunit ribosomal protein L29
MKRKEQLESWRALSTDDLRRLSDEKRRELFHLRMRLALGELERPVEVARVRKEIARLETMINAAVAN